MSAPAPDDERLRLVGLVVEMYTTKLDVAHKANRDDPRFCTGLTHARAAMEKLRRALAGETDLVRLGLQDQPSTAPPIPEPDLFGVSP